MCVDDLRSTSGMRIEWGVGWGGVGGRGADPPMARAPVDGRDQGADRGVPQGHLNQIKGFFLFAGSAKGNLQALFLLPRCTHLLLLHPLQEQPEGRGVQAAAGAGSHVGDGGGRDELFALLADSSYSRKTSLCAAA